MLFIQNIIHKYSIKQQRYNQVIDKCIKLSDVDLYLQNLDRQAEILQNSHIGIDNKAYDLIEKRNEQLLSSLNNKIALIVSKNGVSNSELMAHADRLVALLGNDVDMVDMSQLQSVKAYKTYLVANIISQGTYRQFIQEKTL